jgi:hypothetical protein
MSHDKQCEAMLMPPDMNRAQLCHCRLREVAAERDALRAELRDHEDAVANKRQLTRELDVAMHGEDGAAKQASLCDLIGPAKKLRAERDALRKDAERYRWLRERLSHQRCGPNVGWGTDELLPGDDPDDAIDSALAKGE